jgi:malonate-semialdehyde dehydrogenase (acetylating) / methylmalonate-semialdehyde dehydrogenase
LRGLQVVETAAGITSTLMGDKIEGICRASLSIDLIAPKTLPIVSKDMDTEVRRVPLGVCASIAPFNFPA